MPNQIKVIIIDDSAFMRKALSKMLESDTDISVIATARDGAEGLDKIRTLKPDVVTLDVDMPRMDGITALKHIMAENPLPVLMVSSLTKEGAQITLEALDIGAVDFIAKNLADVSLNISKIQEELIQKIKAVSSKKRTVRRLAMQKSIKGDISLKKVSRSFSPSTFKTRRIGVIAIGVSTGGPKALQAIFRELPADFPVGIIVVQHMPEAFIELFTQRLNNMCPLNIELAKNGDLIRPGRVLIAPVGKHLTVYKPKPTEVQIKLKDEPIDSLHKPSVDVMMKSVATTFSGRSIGVLLTGMGRDGAEGLKAIKMAHGKTMVQDEETSVVFGMPKAAIDLGAAEHIVPIEKIPGELINMV